MSGKFIKNKEDFTCAHCGFEVVGNGFTNHCPKCLYSLHVDVFPGDREAGCGGLMEPVALEGTQKEYVIVHKCKACGTTKKNKISMDDSFDSVAAVARKAADKLAGK